VVLNSGRWQPGTRQAADFGLLLVGLAAVGFGLRVLFARWSFAGGLTPEAVSALTIVPTALVCLPWVIGRYSGEDRAAIRLALWAFLIGLLVAVGNIAYMRALEGLPVATATLIYFSYPLFVIALGRVTGDVTLRPRALVAAGLILAGCAAVLSPDELAGLDLFLVALCFAAPLSYAVLVLLLARKLIGLSLPVRVGLITLGASVILVPTAFLGILASAPLPGTGLWLGVLGLVVVCGVIPQFATTVGIPLAGADRAAIAGAIELLVALLAGWVLLGEAVTTGQLIGTVLIGSAVLLARS
jgi:drug/metabolite transporter (DMT)-like permease